MTYHFITSLPLITCALFTVLLALEWNNKQLREQRTLFVFMLTATILYMGHYVFFNHVDHLIPVMDIFYVTANLAVYPLYLIYIIRLTTLWKSWYGWVLLPATIGAVACSIAFFMMTDEENALFTEHYLYHNLTDGLAGVTLLQAWIHIGCKIVFAIEVLVTIVVGVRMIRKYDNAVNQLYADTDNKSMHHIQSVLYLIVVASVMSFVANAIGRYRFTDSCYLLFFPSMAFSILLFTIGYLGLHRQFSFADLEGDKVFMYDKEKGNEVMDKSLTERIVEIVKRDKIYLQPDLKLEDLARMMNTNRTYIYQAINLQMGITFNEFINRQRIAYAKQLMVNNPNLTTNEISIQSGFASLSSFYRNLKKYKDT